MSKIAPEKKSPYRVVHVKDKPNILDFDKDGDVDMKDLSYCFKKQLRCVSYLYDVTLGNVPWLAIIALLTTIISSSFIVSGINSSQNILAKYSYQANSLVSIYSLVLLGFILVDVCVLIQGLSICGLETFRELQDKDKKINLNCCFKCNRLQCQLIWALVGTGLILLLYFIGLGYAIVSSLGTVTSYYCTQTCFLFTDMVNQYQNDSLTYIETSKNQLNQADSTAINILYQYNDFVDLKQSFENSGIGQISTIVDPTFVDIQNYSFLMMPAPPEDQRLIINRRLNQVEEVFDPRVEIAKGRSVYSVLNQSIYETEKQYQYYHSQAKKIEQVCYDFAGIYDSLYLISVGMILIMIAHYLTFANHYKYFSVWNYEMRLLRNGDYK